MDELKTELIALEVIKTLKGRFDNFPEDEINNRNAPFHEAFLKAFSLKIESYVKSVPIFVSLASWMHGLSTTLGQTFFENIAHILSDGEKKTFKQKQITLEQRNTIQNIITNLSNGNIKPDLIKENELLFSADKSEVIDSTDFVVDNYFEDSNSVTAVELKTVKPNKGIFKEEKTKILTAKAALSRFFPSKDIKYFLAFPFDPLSDTSVGYDKTRFMNYSVNFTKYFDSKEVLLASEFWNYMSGEDRTMNKILEIINSVATPDFMENFLFLNNMSNIAKEKKKYLSILEKWNLLKEKKIIENYDKLFQIVKSNNRLYRILNQSIFKEDGTYNVKRSDTFLDLL